MRARLPSASKESKNAWLRRREILRTDCTECRDSHFLNDTIRHDGNRLDAFNVEKDDEPAISVSCRYRENAPPLHTGCKRMAGHVRRNTQRPHSGSRTSTFLRFEPISKPRMHLGFDGKIHLAAWAIECDAFGEFPVNVFSGG